MTPARLRELLRGTCIDGRCPFAGLVGPKRGLGHGLHARPTLDGSEAAHTDRGGHPCPILPDGRSPVRRRGRRRGPAARTGLPAGWRPTNHPGRQRQRLHLPRPPPAGRGHRGHPRLVPARQAHGPWVHRSIQPEASGGAPERPGVPQPSRKPGQIGAMAQRRQRWQTTPRHPTQGPEHAAQSRVGAPARHPKQPENPVPGGPQAGPPAGGKRARSRMTCASGFSSAGTAAPASRADRRA